VVLFLIERSCQQECKIMGVEYMQVVLDNLNERFPTNLHIFNASSSFLVHS